MHKVLVPLVPLLPLGLLSVALLASWTLPADRLMFAPDRGASLVRTITIRADLSLETIETAMNGEADTKRPPIEMDVAWTRSLAVTDRFDALRAGAPEKLTREFTALGERGDYTLVIGDEEENGAPEGSSGLEGRTVVFAWNPAKGEYDKSFEGDGPRVLLDGLVEDLDLRELLPDGEVAEEDTWQVDPADFVAILRPGGGLGIEMEPAAKERRKEAIGFGVDPVFATDLERMIGEIGSGSKVTATYAGASEVDGARMGRILFDFEVNTARDAVACMEEALGDFDEVEIEISHGGFELFLEGEAELTWNLAAGHMSAFSLKARTTLAVSRVAQAMIGENEMELSTDMTFVGELTYTSTSD